MEIKKIIKVPPYYCDVVMILTDSFKDTNYKHKLFLTDIDISGNYSMMVVILPYPNGCARYYLLIDSTVKQSVGDIAHEAKHLVNKIYLSHGCLLDEDNDEPECYLLGWITNRINEFINGK